MLQPIISKYFSEQKTSFFKNYKTVTKVCDVDAIHDLRVSIKRLDSLFRLLNYNCRANYRLRQSFKPIKLVFKQTGEIREFQIFQKLVVQYQEEMESSFPGILIICNHKAKKMATDYSNRSKLSNYQLLKRNFNIFERNIASQSESEFIRKMEGLTQFREQNYRNYANPNNEYNNLHSARKAIKDLIYLNEMLGVENEEVEKLQLKYKQVGRLLGDWHDRAILNGYLVSIKDKAPAGSKNIEFLIDKVKADKIKLREEFYATNASY